MSQAKGKRTVSFKEFKEHFYAAFDDPAVFDCQDVNLLKVVQDGLKVQYSFKSSWGAPLWLYQCLRFLKRWKAILFGQKNPFDSMRFQGFEDRPYLLLDAGRYVRTEEETLTSVYFHRLCETIPPEQRIFMLERQHPEAKITYDFTIHDFAAFHYFLPINQEHRSLYKELQQTFNTWKQQTRFSAQELTYIKRALELFWEQSLVWEFLADHFRSQWAILTCHYHKEGQILALKRKGIKVIELQHGLIAPEDIFYVYPEKVASVTSRALFADEIWTYGTYWREVLLNGSEYKPQQIKVLGYYLYEKQKRNQAFIHSIRERTDGAPVLLLTTQFRLFQTFIDYVQWLSQDMIAKNIQGLIIVKPHPNNREGTFEELSTLPNVLISRDDLYDLFASSDMHVSIYSTTLYEATRLGLTNFSLYVESCKDYINSILASGIARKLEWGINPFELTVDQDHTVQSETYFAPFQWPDLEAEHASSIPLETTMTSQK